MKYFAHIKNEKLMDITCAKYLSCTNIEVTKEIYENREKYMFDGKNIVIDPDYEKKQKQSEKERIQTLSLTKREVFLALYEAKKITPDMVKSQISDPKQLIEFEYANEYFRGNPLIDLIGEKLGYTSEDLDYLFKNKELPNKEEISTTEETSDVVKEALNS